MNRDIFVPNRHFEANIYLEWRVDGVYTPVMVGSLVVKKEKRVRHLTVVLPTDFENQPGVFVVAEGAMKESGTIITDKSTVGLDEAEGKISNVGEGSEHAVGVQTNSVHRAARLVGPFAGDGVEESPEALFVGHPVLRDADGEGGSVHPAHFTLTTDGLAGSDATTRATITAGPDVTAVAAGIGLAAVASVTDVTAVAAAGVATVVVATGAAIAAHGGRARGFGGVTSTSQVGEQEHAPQKEGDGQHALLHHRLPPGSAVFNGGYVASEKSSATVLLNSYCYASKRTVAAL